MQTHSLETDTILISSCSMDGTTWKPVADELVQKGYDVTVFEADKVALGDVQFEVSVCNANGLTVQYDNRQLCVKAIAAAWFRRPSFITNPREDGATQMGIDGERRSLQSGVWSTIPDETWLNSPDSIVCTERKMTQLQLAQQVGFSIPDTVVSNDWSSIENKLPPNVICKSSYSMFYDGDSYRQIYTTPFINNPSALPLELNPYPGIWQPALQKAREWRITVVGDETFDAAVYTADDAKDDWRKHQLLPGAVEFRKEQFPSAYKEKCFQYLSAMGLQFGAFDFIEDNDGQITFLECNPNGQYMWVEHQLGLPISSAITGELIRIARSERPRLAVVN